MIYILSLIALSGFPLIDFINGTFGKNNLENELTIETPENIYGKPDDSVGASSNYIKQLDQIQEGKIIFTDNEKFKAPTDEYLWKGKVITK